MTFQHFDKWMRKIERKVGRRPMSPEAMVDRYEVLRTVPGPAWDEIASRWWFREKHFPEPGELEDDWSQWLDSHPEKQDRRYGACRECCGHGGYLVTGLAGQTTLGNPVDPEEGQWVTCTCRPAPEFGPGKRKIRGIQMSRSNLRAVGCLIVWPSPAADEEDSVPLPEQMTEGIGSPGQEDIPF